MGGPGAAGADPRFRRLVDGRPSWVLLARNAAAHVSLVLGPKPGLNLVERGVGRLVSGDAAVYAFDGGNLAQVCQRLNLTCWDGRKASPRPPLQPPESPMDWLAQFCGVATKYLHHYMAWFSFQVTGRRQVTACASGHG